MSFSSPSIKTGMGPWSVHGLTPGKETHWALLGFCLKADKDNKTNRTSQTLPWENCEKGFNLLVSDTVLRLVLKVNIKLCIIHQFGKSV